MKKKISLIFWYMFLFAYLEVIYRCFVFNNVLSTSLVNVIVFSMCFGVFFYLFTSLFNKMVSKCLTVTFSFVITLYLVAQIIYFKFYGSMFSLMSLFKGGAQVTGFMEVIIKITLNNIIAVIVSFIPFILFCIFKNRVFAFEKKTFVNNSKIFIIFVILFVYKMFFVNICDSYKKVYYDTYNPMVTIEKMGFYSMQILDIKRMIFGFTETISYGDECKYDENSSNVLKIKFDDSDFNKYIKSVCPTKKNKYTGVFKNKNLIFITAESFNGSLIDKNLTPTLYKLASEGVQFNNYYQPLYPVSTSDGEYMLLTSLYPAEGKWSLEYSSDNKMIYGLGNVFETYTKNAYHNGDYNYYKRYLSHTNLGFNYKACNHDFDSIMNCKQWPTSDYDMFKNTVGEYINEDNFVTYYITVSGHLSYSNSNAMTVKNYDKVKNLSYSDEVKGYIAANLELEKALTYLVKELEKNDKLDDTLIVISPDHYPYGMLSSEINEISKSDANDKFDKHRNTLIMYNKAINGIAIDNYVSSIDVLPTILNLFGVKYDSRLLMGKDIFAGSNNIVILTDRSFITTAGHYDSITNKFTAFKDDASKDYVNKMKEEVDKRVDASRYILLNNYYKDLKYESN